MDSIEVVAGIIHRDGEVYATQRGYGAFEGLWEFPGGKIEPGETPREALARELREELCVEVEIERHLCTVEYDYPDFHLTLHCFICSLSGGTLTLTEHKSARWTTLRDIDSLAWLPADRSVIAALRRAFPD